MSDFTILQLIKKNVAALHSRNEDPEGLNPLPCYNDLLQAAQAIHPRDVFLAGLKLLATGSPPESIPTRQMVMALAPHQSIDRLLT